MPFQNERRWILVAAIIWAVALAVVIAGGRYLRAHSTALLNYVVSTDPEPKRQALYRRMEADRLVREALRQNDAATSGGLAPRPRNGALIPEVAPLLQQAERLYLESYDETTTRTGLLFQLGEVNFLMGRRARGYLYLARYWDAVGEKELARAYRRRAGELDSAATIPLRDDRASSAP